MALPADLDLQVFFKKKDKILVHQDLTRAKKIITILC